MNKSELRIIAIRVFPDRLELVLAADVDDEDEATTSRVSVAFLFYLLYMMDVLELI
ncbi:uncharacterized protein STEHIDRAFT_122137 [Stereum hirsutum FP-91666 SS1]|uniref:uncharacterized protein n=1 Tax=Stereum hirsutum (strain FP-91666) TaxID=721885 RepID=UPI0004449EFC|nr:uncharacterized protein STEHIDRAFT_122137 [Stereum hirsutum FP-91666 SS1]EIM86172.1 hypothetical protein STEHIDRAFT_122137 [Stereum hirsutum FP-91666 SS1]